MLVPVYQKMEEAFEKHPDVTVVLIFVPFRSVYTSVMEILNYSDQIKTVAIIAEGIPKSQTHALNKDAHKRGVGIFWPATVSGIKVRAWNLTSSCALAYSHCLNHSSFSHHSLAAFALETRAVCLTISSCPNSIGQVRSRTSQNLEECPMNSTISFVATLMESTRVWQLEEIVIPAHVSLIT